MSKLVDSIPSVPLTLTSSPPSIFHPCPQMELWIFTPLRTLLFPSSPRHLNICLPFSGASLIVEDSIVMELVLDRLTRKYCVLDIVEFLIVISPTLQSGVSTVSNPYPLMLSTTLFTIVYLSIVPAPPFILSIPLRERIVDD